MCCVFVGGEKRAKSGWKKYLDFLVERLLRAHFPWRPRVLVCFWPNKLYPDKKFQDFNFEKLTRKKKTSINYLFKFHLLRHIIALTSIPTLFPFVPFELKNSIIYKLHLNFIKNTLQHALRVLQNLKLKARVFRYFLFPSFLCSSFFIFVFFYFRHFRTLS